MQSRKLSVTFHAQDFDRTLVFFRDTLGLALKHSWNDPHSRGAIFAAEDSAEVEFFGPPEGQSQNQPSPSGMNIAFLVDDVDAHYARLMAAGVQLVEDIGDRPWGNRSFGIQSPDGLHVWLFSEIPPQEGAAS
ncbi:MAG: VOC family protein [Anaerolineaceae bacterium]|nr:VOC family protein [Anaerolineaceae bacterium]